MIAPKCIMARFEGLVWAMVFSVCWLTSVRPTSAASLIGQSSSVAAGVYIVHLRGHSVQRWRNLNFAARYKPMKQNPLEDLETERLDAQRLQEQYTKYLIQTHDDLLTEVLEHGSFEKLYSYTFLVNAISVKLVRGTNTQILTLRNHPKVLFVEREHLFKKTTTHTPDFLNLPRGAWKAVGGIENAGENMVIGMVDTGIDPCHPSFTSNVDFDSSTPSSWKGKCAVGDQFPRGSCKHKIIGAQYFNKGIIAATLFNESYDFASPFDGDGHGTHTSSIVAGNSGVPVIVRDYNYGFASGVAPRARLAIYKVIYRDGGFLSDVLAGIDQAVQDEVDVLSISLGSSSGTYGLPSLNTFDIALLFAVKAGVVVVHAAGNNGPYPMSMNSFGPWVISVAAGITDRSYPNQVVLGTGQHFVGQGFSEGTTGKDMYPLIYAEDAFINETSEYDAEYFSYCQDAAPFNASLVRRKILLCNYVDYYSGGAAAQFEAAMTTAQKLNAVGLLILTEAATSDAEREKHSNADPFPFTLPASFVTDPVASKLILQYYKQHSKKDKHGKVKEFGAVARLKDSRKASFGSEAPQVSSFSARGPIYSDTVTSIIADVLKPDILAPGNQIWGAWTPKAVDTNGYKGQSFAMLSGTSMAAPHVAGVAALVKQKHPDWDVFTIHSALLTTASQADSRGNPLLAQQPSTMNDSVVLGAGTPFDFGSGSINASAALDPGLVFQTGFQDHINFLCTLPGADSNTVQDATGGTCDTQVGARSSDLNVPSITVANLIGSRVVKRVVTNVGAEETYVARVGHPAGVHVAVRPGVFTVKPERSVSFKVTLTVRKTMQRFTFGSLTWRGNNGHVVYVPISTSANSMSG